MGILNSLKKILRGEDLDWHNPLPPVVGPDEVLARCTPLLRALCYLEKRYQNPFLLRRLSVNSLEG